MKSIDFWMMFESSEMAIFLSLGEKYVFIKVSGTETTYFYHLHRIERIDPFHKLHSVIVAVVSGISTIFRPDFSSPIDRVGYQLSFYETRSR